MTVSDQDTKMDVDIVTPNDTPGSHTHLTDPPSTLKGTLCSPLYFTLFAD